MAQSNYTIANQLFPATRANINSVFDAVKSSNSGASAPSDVAPGTIWLDTTDDMLKIRNVADSGWEDVKKMGVQLPAAITTNTTLTAASNLRTIRVDATSGNVTITLPAAADGLAFNIVRVDAGIHTVIISRAGSDLINGATTALLTAQFMAVTLYGAASNVWLASYSTAYVRGTWTPAYGGSGGAPTTTYTTQAGEFIKMGNLVHIEGRIDVNTTTGGSGNMRITGLPFTISQTTAAVGSVNIVKASSWNTANPSMGYMEAGTVIDLTYSASATSIAEVPISHLAASCRLFFSGQYMCVV